MARFRKPFFRSSRNTWFVQLNGKQMNLGPDKTEAFRKYHELMALAPEPVRVTPDLVAVDHSCKKVRRRDFYARRLKSAMKRKSLREKRLLWMRV